MPPQTRRNPRPITPARLEEMALAYVARFATSAARLDDYLRRKLRERGWDGEGEPPVAALVERYVAAGYVDDLAFARARAGSLLRRGYGARRIGQALGAAGIDQAVRDEVHAGADEQRRAALALARKRRLGPFGPPGAPPADRSAREKQVAVLLRAGHPLDSARFLVDAPSVEAAELWAEANEEN
ncbi:MAG: RecX family transcriptional regulator [Proteobacteria bacterium]|nr:RecX family transcriptional regulator [Pseudomonadota bacterium]